MANYILTDRDEYCKEKLTGSSQLSVRECYLYEFFCYYDFDETPETGFVHGKVNDLYPKKKFFNYFLDRCHKSKVPGFYYLMTG